MISLKKQLTGVFATGLLVANTLLPAAALADTSVTISGNGAGSTSTTSLTNSNTTTAVQNNSATVTNTIDNSAQTGHNTASGNTGGEVTVSTGNANIDTTVTNTLNGNRAAVGCCTNGTSSTTISGNGAGSANSASLEQANTNQLFQTNRAEVENSVTSRSVTGENTAGNNTGGTTRILTGDANIQSTVSTNANANAALIGGNNGGSTGSVDITESGNGSGSTNSIDTILSHDNLITQDNMAAVSNRVSSYAKSGDNNTGGNTGGSVLVLTGNANSAASVDNRVNFNVAEIDCGCLADVSAKTSGNGDGSANSASVNLGNSAEVFQGSGEKGGNYADLLNSLGTDVQTGDNAASANTGPVMFDPVMVLTGDSNSTASVSSTGNQNVFGRLADLGGVSVSFDLQDLMTLFHFG